MFRVLKAPKKRPLNAQEILKIYALYCLFEAFDQYDEGEQRPGTIRLEE
jgi:acyl-CoA-binding protein